MINPNDIIRTYSGKPGCMCGCCGKYNENPKTFKATLTRMMNSDYRVEFWDNDPEEGGCIFYETPTRNNVIYFRKESLTPDQVPSKHLSQH